MQPSFAKYRDFWIQKIDVNAQKVDGFCLETFGMVIAIFQMEDKIEIYQYFEKIFLLAELV